VGIVLFDGTCNLCNATIGFVIPRDRTGRLRFASLQSAVGQELLRRHGIPAPSTPDSIVYIEGERAFTRSDAALAIAGRLDRPWPLCGLFWYVPRSLRDAVYSFVARNRYRWFGRTETCQLPTPELRDRFLD
jgi:predicted DCC family thiol-disulfide oxidoreductase YuxK